jgi:hypothetical protein
METGGMSDLRDWLRGNNFERFAEVFEANDIDLDIPRRFSPPASARFNRWMLWQ